jgi:hypothetical protein
MLEFSSAAELHLLSEKKCPTDKLQRRARRRATINVVDFSVT